MCGRFVTTSAVSELAARLLVDEVRADDSPANYNVTPRVEVPIVAETADPDAPWVRSCAIVTTSANDTMAPVHDRMPVILAPESWDTWLDPDNHDVEALEKLLVPAPNDTLEWYPIRMLVNKPQNNFA